MSRFCFKFFRHLTQLFIELSHNFDSLVEPQSILNLNDLRWISVILEFFISPKIGCPAFLIQFKFEVERHVTHSWKKIIAVHSNHLFWFKTRLHFGSILAKVSALVYGPRSQVPKTPMLSGRGTPPPFSKNTKSHFYHGSGFHMVTALSIDPPPWFGQRGH